MPGLFAAISCPAPVPGLIWIYILRSADRSLYISQTHDLHERLRQNRLGQGSKRTHDHGQPRLVCSERPVPLDEAVQREAQHKRWARAQNRPLSVAISKVCVNLASRGIDQWASASVSLTAKG